MVLTKKFSDFTDGGDLSNDKTTVGIGLGGNTKYNNPWTFLPDGSTGDRPPLSADMHWRLRLNTTTQSYEYYNPITLEWIDIVDNTGSVNPGLSNNLGWYAANGSIISPLVTIANGVLVTDITGVPSVSSTLPAGLNIPTATITNSTAALTSGQITAVPSIPTDIANKSYVDATIGVPVTSIAGTPLQVIASSPTGAVTLSLPQDIATISSPTFNGLTLSNFIKGVQFIQSSASENLLSFTYVPSAVNYINIQNAATGNGVLISSSGTDTDIDLDFETKGLGTYTFTTLESNGVLNVVSGTAFQHTTAFNFPNTLATRTVTLQDANGTLAYLSDIPSAIVSSITGTALQVISSSPTGAVTLSLPQDIAMTSNPTFATLTLTNALTVANGGTGIQTATSYTLLAGGTTPTGALQSLTPGTSGQLLQSGGASALPTWTTSTFPSASGTLNHMLRSDGTNWIETSATTLTSSDVLSGLTQLNVDNLRVDGNSLLSTSGNLVFQEGVNPNILLYNATNHVGGVNNIQLWVAGGSNIYHACFDNGALSAPIQFMSKSRGSTPGTYATVVAGDNIGTTKWQGSDATQFYDTAQVQVKAEGTIGAGIIPGIWILSTTNSSGTLTQALSVNSTQSALFSSTVTGKGIISGLSTGAAGNYFQSFSQTTSLGSFTISSNNNSGNFANNLTNDPTSAARTWTFPDASGTVQLSGATTLITAPAASQSSALLVGTAFQNVLGYDVVLTVYLAVTAAVDGTILLGVGPTNTPTQQTIVSGLNLVGAFIIVPVTIYLPSGYYALLSTGGTSVEQTIS